MANCLLHVQFCCMLVAVFMLQQLVHGNCLDIWYPPATRGVNTSDHLYVVDDYSWSIDDQLLVQSLQGVSARTAPAVYRNQSDGPPGPQTNAAPMWLDLLLDFNLVTTVTEVESARQLLSYLVERVTGYVLGDASQPNSALTAASGLDGNVVVATEVTEILLQEHGVGLVMDVRNMSVLEVINALNGSAQFSRCTVSMQEPAKGSYLADFTIFSRGITFFAENMSDEIVTRVMSWLKTPATVFGWGRSEEDMVQTTSHYGHMVHAADWALNLATLTNYHIPSVQWLSLLSQKGETSTRATAGHCSVANTRSTSVHTVTFFLTDGDNIQWLLSNFATSSSWWASPLRGQVPLGWTLSPALDSLAPVVMHYLYTTATSNDTFLAAPSGLGYVYPDLMLKAPDGREKLGDFADLTLDHMKKTGMTVLNVLGWEYSQEAANLMTTGTKDRDNAEEDVIQGVFWMSKASAEHGEINRTPAGVPVVLPRYQLAWWADNVTTLLDKLEAMPKDPTSPLGYSMIPVFVWDYGVPDVVTLVAKLEEIGGFDIVSPTEFLTRISTWLLVDDARCESPAV